MAERGNGQPDLNKGKPVETDAAPGLDEQRLLNTFFELVRIASPSHYEADVAAYCQAVLLDAGWQVTIDDSAAVTGSDTGNLTATLAGSAATRGAAAATGGVAAAATATSPTAADHLFFSAHLDTVEPASGIVPVLSDGVIRSAGATILGGDDKAGVAALLEMARVLGERARRPPPQALQRPLPPISIVLSVQEEIGLNGAKAYDSRAMSGQPCFVLDAAGAPGTVVIGAPYQRSFTAEVTGLAAHAGVAPEKGISAIQAAAAAIAQLPLGRLDERTTANVGTITGGVANNIVAERCSFTGECRSHDADALKRLCEQVQTIITEQAESAGASVNILWEDNYDGYSFAPDDPLVRYCLSVATALGLPAASEISGGGADTNIYAARGARALSLGTGMTNIHGTDECLAERDLVDLTRYVLALIENWPG